MLFWGKEVEAGVAYGHDQKKDLDVLLNFNNVLYFKKIGRDEERAFYKAFFADGSSVYIDFGAEDHFDFLIEKARTASRKEG